MWESWSRRQDNADIKTSLKPCDRWLKGGILKSFQPPLATSPAQYTGMISIRRHGVLWRPIDFQSTSAWTDYYKLSASLLVGRKRCGNSKKENDEIETILRLMQIGQKREVVVANVSVSSFKWEKNNGVPKFLLHKCNTIRKLSTVS